MEERRDQLADALYQKGLALAEIESLKVQHLTFHFMIRLPKCFFLVFVTHDVKT